MTKDIYSNQLKISAVPKGTAENLISYISTDSLPRMGKWKIEKILILDK